MKTTTIKPADLDNRVRSLLRHRVRLAIDNRAQAFRLRLITPATIDALASMVHVRLAVRVSDLGWSWRAVLTDLVQDEAGILAFIDDQIVKADDFLSVFAGVATDTMSVVHELPAALAQAIAEKGEQRSALFAQVRHALEQLEHAGVS